jgi:hypothetical protein
VVEKYYTSLWSNDLFCPLLNIQSNWKADKALAIDPKDKNALYNKVVLDKL